MKTLGKKLRYLRLQRDIKQEELADLLSITQQQYSKLERGTVKIVKIVYIQVISKFYYISIWELIEE